MGGKAQRARRTKNNARPSSSGRTAELLNNSGKDVLLFGAGASQPLMPLFPTIAVVNFEQGLNSEYILCFKKFGKKDPITKTKALQELHDLLKNGNADEVVAALPAWAHFYPILTIDSDRKVRECTQMCHASLVQACGRRLAPQLRRLLPAWLLAQHDDHGPAQYHAQSALTNTFPAGKLSEAMTFCKEEIVNLLLENLMGNVEGTLNKTFDNEEDKLILVSHIIASSLRALEQFVAQLPVANDDWLWNCLLPLLRAPSFWKMIQQSNEQKDVRAAWYGAVGQMTARFKQRFGTEFGARAGRALLAAPERPPAAAHRWAALLLLMHNVQDWHTWFDKKELLVKRILEVLENGGWGDARLLSELLLPLLARLPSDLLTGQFYQALFNAMFAGLEKKNVLSSKSERQAWVANVADCLRHLSTQPCEFVVEVGSCVHRTWLTKVLAVHDDQCRKNLIKYSVMKMAALLKFWLKRSKEDDDQKYEQLVRAVWQNLGSILSSQVDAPEVSVDGIHKVIEDHILLLQTLKTAINQDEKKQLTIKFAGDPEVEPEAKIVTTSECDAAAAERYRHNLDETVERMCAMYLDFAGKHKAADAVLAPLVALLVEFDSERLYRGLARHFGADSVYGLYERLLRNWLMDEAMQCRALLDVVFLLLKYLSEQEQDWVFDSFELLEQGMAEWCLALCVSHPHCEERAPGRWLRAASAQRALMQMSARAMRAGDAPAAALLLRCLAHTVDGESVASKDTIEEMVVQVRSAVAEMHSAQLERRARTAAQLCGALLAARSPYVAALAAALFALQLHVPRGDERLPLDTWLEVRSSWQDAVMSLQGAARRALLADIVSLVHDKLFENVDSLDVTKVENIVSLLPYVVTASEYAPPPSEGTERAELAALSAQLLALPGSRATPSAELCALRIDCIMGNLNCPFDDNNPLIRKIIEESSDKEVAELDREELVLSAHKWIFKASYMRTFLLRRSATDDADDEQLPWCNEILKDEYFRDQFLSLLYDYMVLSTLNDRYAFWPGYEIIQQTKRRFDDLLKEMIDETSVDVRQQLLASLSEKSAAIGYYWSYARRYYEKEMEKRSPADAPAVAAAAGSRIATPAPLERDETTTATTDGENSTTQTNNKETDQLTDAQVEDFDLAQIVTGSGYFHSLQASAGHAADPGAVLHARLALALRGVQAAHGADARIVDADFLSYAARCLRDGNVDVLINLQCRFHEVILSERELLSASWAHVVSNAAVLDLADALVAARGWDLPPHHWDFVTLTLAGLLESLALSVDNWGCAKMALLCRSALQLFVRVRSFVGDIRQRSEQRRPPDHLLALATEWDDIFAPTINMHIFKIIITVLESTEVQLTSARAVVVGALVACVEHLQWEKVPAELRASEFVPSETRADGPGPSEQPGGQRAGELPPGGMRAGELARGRIARAAAGAPAHPPTSLLSYKVLRLLAEGLVLDDAAMLAQWSELEEGTPRPALSLAHYDDALMRLEQLVDAALSDVSECESCEMAAGSEGERVARAYLLLSVAVYEQCQLARGDLVHHYIEHFRAQKYAEYLIACSVRLLPAELVAYAQDDRTAPPPAHYLPHFVTTPEFTVEEVCLPASVDALACRAFLAALVGAGGVDARGWWGALGGRQSRAVRRLVAACVTPHLQRTQLAELKRRAATLPDTHISLAWNGEARCSLQVEDHSLELCMQMSDVHPLVPPRVFATAQPAMPDTRWLTVYLAYQNGTLFNALKMWVRAVSSRVENSAQCYVCYCRLHPTSGRLATAGCRQCRNKFHTQCLRKWFSSSGNSKCPLCRSDF
ncbi:E3 ubiquitin-protein ligase listerin [Battus philenor]|uniref:E3 ubiquitin-protein ligase listerin n=1 Tax=Battus philenor TaxID=42288 RepID=UPI0035D03BBE